MVRQFWPFVAPMLKAAISRTNLSRFQDIEDDVLDGDGLLWLAVADHKILAAATTILVRVENGLVCVLTACGGNDMSLWLPLLEGIEKYAKAEGCLSLRIFGRKGWGRALPQYKVTNIVLEKPLGRKIH